MAVTYPLALPTGLTVKSFVMAPEQVHSFTESPFSFRKQVALHDGERWEVNMTLPAQTHEKGREWAAFLTKLRGRYGSFLMGDLTHSTPAGSAGTTPGTPVVNGASQTGDALNIDGAPNSKTGYLKAGDYIGISNRLYMVLNDASSNATGQVSLDIWPALRSSPADNATVILTSPKTSFRLAGEIPDWAYDSAGYYHMQIRFLEDL